MSPRKSSTSSGRPRTLRPRYLGVEVAGEHLPPGFPARWWEERLGAMLASAGGPEGPVRVLRVQGPRAIVAIDQFRTAAARRAWNGPAPDGPGWHFVTRRTWGTLVGAKTWIARPGPAGTHDRPG